MAVDSMSVSGSVSGKSSKWSTLPGFRESWPGLLAIVIIALFCELPVFHQLIPEPLFAPQKTFQRSGQPVWPEQVVSDYINRLSSGVLKKTENELLQ